MYIARVLVIAHSEENRLAQPSIRRPFGELHLDNYPRSHPVSALVRPRQLHERTPALFERFEPLPHRPESLAIEAASSMANILERAVLIEVAEEYRSEKRTGPTRLGEAADDEFFSMLQLQFQPISRARARLVLRVGALR